MNGDSFPIRRLLVLLGAGLSVGVLLAVMFWPSSNAPSVDALLNGGQAQPSEVDASALPFGLSAATMSGDPLDREPANLAAFANAQSQLRFARDHGGAREEVSAWRIDGAPLHEVIAFYESQVSAKGFRHVEDVTRSGESGADTERTVDERLLIFVGSEPQTQGHILTVRLAEQTDSVHAQISLRYPVTQ